MEAIGAGASVLAFAGFAFEGTKFLYKAVAGFKHAPQEVAALVSTVARLQDTLAQICSSRALNDPDVDAQHITGLFDACNRDIASFGHDLKRVQSLSAEPALLQTWKKFKATLSEDRLISMRNRLDHHCAVLQLELTRLQSTITLDCRDGIRGLQDTANAESLQVSTLVQTVQVVKSSIENQVNCIQTLQDTATAGDSRLSALIQDVRSIKSSMEDQMQSMTLSTTSAVEKHAAVGSSELNTISIAVKALQDQISALPEQVAATQRASASSEEHFVPRSTSPNAMLEDLDLSRSLERLRQLSTCDPRTFQDEEADAIVEDLECLLAALLQADKNYSPESPTRKRKPMDPVDAITGRDMKRIRGLISAATSVVVNQSPRRSKVNGSKRIMQQHKVKDFVLQNCTMIVTMNKRKIQRPGRQTNHQRPAADQYEEELYATIKTFISGMHSPSVIVATVRQMQYQNGVSSLHPVISVGRVLPLNSPIFDIVSRGTVDELREFLACGKGTLRDRDIYGTSLLHYVVSANYRHNNVEMCKFLIEQGADVDEVAKIPERMFTGEGFDGTPLQATILESSSEPNGEKVGLVKLLLAAGADPTLSTGYYIPALSLCAAHNSQEMLKAIVNNQLPFVELEQRHNDMSILLEVAQIAESDDWRAMLDHLLTNGADYRPLPMAVTIANIGVPMQVTFGMQSYHNMDMIYGKCGKASTVSLSTNTVTKHRNIMTTINCEMRTSDTIAMISKSSGKAEKSNVRIIMTRQSGVPTAPWCQESVLGVVPGMSVRDQTGHQSSGHAIAIAVSQKAREPEFASGSDNENAYDDDESFDDESPSENDYVSEGEDTSEDEAHISLGRVQEVEESETDDMYGAK
ncbi:hypothetical protein H2200_002982 [Cladophialophora chaetospira]|uniref:Azaphilone pigments biosynthesis cluster protein L N-terminal domain-containing protein n=1 Tax=Cladophialophora chaetospira TaxID=386627 RepID=A0AA39CM86_9EURO|nr:hypothetical protein H2200_002982 [Cladophialophora chaetospira]